MANGQTNHPEPLEDPEVDGNEDNSDVENEDELDDADAETEYAALDQTLDQLDTCLDQLGQKNGDLNAKLRALLEASRQDYEELTAAKMGDGHDGDDHQQNMEPEAGGAAGC